MPPAESQIRSTPRRDARAQLIEAHVPLAHSIARGFDRSGRVPLEDLQQVAVLGLIRAVDRFDPTNGAAFTSFAVPTIQGEIRRYFRDTTWTVRPPRQLHERAIRAMRERELLTRELQRSPTAAELAERLGCSMEQVLESALAMQARTGESLDRPADVEREDGDAVGDLLGTEDHGFAAAEAKAVVDRLLRELPTRDRLALRLRFGSDLTQAEIAELIGCSRMQVSRMLRRALARLAVDARAEPGETPAPRGG